MTKSLLTTTFTFLLLLIFSADANAQTAQKKANSNVQVLQFHSEHRCITCNLIEKLTRETLQKYPSVAFTLINVDDSKNEKTAEQFEATGTALFLFNPKTGAKKDLTNFAFMNASSKPAAFKKGLEKEIKAFK